MTHDPDTLERQGAEWASRLIQRAIDDRNEARSLLDDAKRQIDALTLSLDDLRASLGEAEAVLDVWRKRAERAEAELLKLQPIGGKPWWIRPKPDGYDPGAREVLPPDPFEDLQEALSDARRAEREATKPKQPTPILLEVGQRWVFLPDPGGAESPPEHDDIITDIRAEGRYPILTIESGRSRHTDWIEDDFRLSHPRLRDPSELEPTKPSLPVLPNTCGECEHSKPCDCHLTGPLSAPCREIRCAHPMGDPTHPGVSRDKPPPRSCPLRTTKPKETT